MNRYDQWGACEGLNTCLTGNWVRFEEAKELMKQAYQIGYSRGHNDTVEGTTNLSCMEDSECFDEWFEENG